jgi:hypothetical protein
MAGLYIDIDGDAIEGDMESIIGKEAMEALFKTQKEELLKKDNIIFT